MKEDPILDTESEITLINGKTITVRPFAVGSLRLCKQLGLTMFTGGDDEAEENAEVVEKTDAADENEETEDELSEDMMWQLTVFFWAQTEDIHKVLGHIRKDTWTEEAELFGLLLPVHEMGNMMAEVNRISRMTSENAVDVLPKGDSDSEEEEPGN